MLSGVILYAFYYVVKNVHKHFAVPVRMLAKIKPAAVCMVLSGLSGKESESENCPEHSVLTMAFGLEFHLPSDVFVAKVSSKCCLVVQKKNKQKKRRNGFCCKFYSEILFGTCTLFPL